MTRHDNTTDFAGFMRRGHLGRFVLPWSTLYSAKCSLKGQFLVDEPLSLRETAGVQCGLPGKNPFQKTKGESNMKSSPFLGALLLYSFQVLGQLWYIRWWLAAYPQKALQVFRKELHESQQSLVTSHLVIGSCHIERLGSSRPWSCLNSKGRWRTSHGNSSVYLMDVQE